MSEDLGAGPQGPRDLVEGDLAVDGMQDAAQPLEGLVDALVGRRLAEKGIDGATGGAGSMQEEINNLAVLGLKFETKSAVRTGIGLGYRSEPYESVVAGKGAWVLNMLRQLMGDAKFQELLQQIFEKPDWITARAA